MSDSMTTKPEGPAQEPLCLCGHNEATHAVQVSSSGSRLHGCYVCSDCDHFVPATPTPSQPAAREWLLQRLHNNGDCITYADLDGDDWERLMDEFARQQTAAKDADEPTPQDIIAAYDRAIKDKEAAERERDSLREFLASEIHNNKCDCLKCIRIRKALKAGKTS